MSKRLTELLQQPPDRGDALSYYERCLNPMVSLFELAIAIVRNLDNNVLADEGLRIVGLAHSALSSGLLAEAWLEAPLQPDEDGGVVMSTVNIVWCCVAEAAARSQDTAERALPLAAQT